MTGPKISFLLLSVVSSIINLFITVSHYNHPSGANSALWVSYLISLVFLILSASPQSLRHKLIFHKSQAIITLLLTILYFSTVFWNFSTAPWNQNGLFDDAAWDIYFARTYVLTAKPFQAAFFNQGISREIFYHYYITAFFKLLGYNLFTFQLSLILLGYITFGFTTALIHKIFNNEAVTVISAAIFNFLPFHFIHIFVGHRYVIATPLLVSSLYFLYTGFRNKSFPRTITSSVLTGFLFQSAIMGKQYLISLVAAGFFYLLFHRKKSFSLINCKLAGIFILSFIITSMPLLVYIKYNPIYFLHERDLVNQFFKSSPAPYLNQLGLIFFGKFTYYRRFLPDYPLLPFSYYFLLLPGIFISLFKKRFELITASFVPVVGAFVAGGHDFRVLHASPSWIILMASTINALITYKKTHNSNHWVSLITTTALVSAISLGLIPSVRYLNSKSNDPDSVFFFAQKDVASARFLRQIVEENPSPSSAFTLNELNPPSSRNPAFHTLICQEKGFAIIHVFLLNHNDKEILSLCDQLPFNLLSSQEIINLSRRAIMNLSPKDGDTRLVWEISEKTQSLITRLRELPLTKQDKVLSFNYSGQPISFYILEIKSSQIPEFKNLLSASLL